MGYSIDRSQGGLGVWYDPSTWFASAPDDATTAQAAGNVRYVLEVYQWTRQTRLWGNNKWAQLNAAGVTSPDASAQLAQLMNSLVDLENQMAPYMQQIQAAQAQLQGAGWKLPADWGFTWDGWQGDDSNPPTAPPDPTPITKAEAQADGQAAGLAGYGSSWFLYGIGAVLIIAAGWALLAAGLSVGAIVALGTGIVLVLSGSPGGQDAIAKSLPAAASNLTSGIGQGIQTGLSIGLPIVAIAAAWILLSGGRRGKSR